MSRSTLHDQCMYIMKDDKSFTMKIVGFQYKTCQRAIGQSSATYKHAHVS